MDKPLDPALAATEAPPSNTAFARTVLQAMEGRKDSPAVPESIPAGAARYATAGVVGEGGMGRVLEARDLQFSRTVAVKQLLHDHAGVGARERFALEALVTGNLEHPGVPTVYERGVLPDGSPFYAMRLVRGRTLGEAISDARDLAARLKLVPTIIKVAQTLGFAHERGIVHRDIKPDNVIVGRYGEAVVLDWGIAKVRGIAKSGDPVVRSGDGTDAKSDSSSATRHGSIMGTPAYMAPEQAAGDVAKIDERTDVFALGALLYHLLTGRAPYAGPTVASVIARAVKAEVDPLSAVAKDAPAGIRAICDKAMSRAPDDRYQTAAELAEALETFTAEAVAGRETSSVRWLTSGLTLAGLIAILLTITFVWGQASSLRDQGFGGWVCLLIAFAGSVLSVIEWRTRGRYRLGGLAFSFALATLFVGIGTAMAGLDIAFKQASQPEVTEDAVKYRWLVAEGTYEALGGLAVAATLAALQVVLSAIARRRAQGPRAEH
jgi:hypothetical protein